MKVAAIYVFPMVNLGTYLPLAQRFTSTFREFSPGGSEFDLHVILNGSPMTKSYARLFEGITAHFHQRDNFGWDIGAFQYAARKIPCDLMVCFGACVHFYRAGWMDRMVETYREQGPNIYGCWAYAYPNAHIRTTCFWLPPQLWEAYPEPVNSVQRSRYEFEHGRDSFTVRLLGLGFDAVVASWKDTWGHPQWPQARFGIGDCLCLDQHTHR